MHRPFFQLSAINAGVKDVRDVIERAGRLQANGDETPILFIDEIHRFSKSQQDSLLNAVERGIITLIGATTENPSFEVISALLSRCQVYILKSLEQPELEQMVQRALSEDARLKGMDIQVDEYDALIALSGGDGRRLLNVLEIAVNALPAGQTHINNAFVLQHAQQNMPLYDKAGEQHYDIISAFIKSMRGSDPNAAVYYLARMIAGGEDPLFIARRMLILASEDIGNANPNALLLANSCFSAVQVIGMPESRIILSQTAVYLATSVKSNASYMAINKAQQLVRETGDLPVPLSLRNAQTGLMKQMGYGADYKYAHDYEGSFTQHEFLPEKVAGTTLYVPGDNDAENRLRARLKGMWGDKYGY